MWVAVGMIGAAGIGYLASSSASGAAADASANAAGAQTASTMAGIDEQRRQFDYTTGLNEPFYYGSMPAYYSLLSAVTGKPQTYYMPDSSGAAAKLTNSEIEAANIEDIKRNMPGWTDTQVKQFMAFYPANLRYKSGGTYYRDANGNLTENIQSVPGAQHTAEVWKPTETPAYKWQQEQMSKNTERTLRGLGRANSSYGMGVISDTSKDLAAAEYDKQLGRLADLTNIARGGASSLASASTGYGNSYANSMNGLGSNLANASLAGGMMDQNSLYNGINSGFSLANLGLKAYNSGLFGNSGNSGNSALSGTGNSYGVLQSDANSSGWDQPSWLG